MGAWVTQSAKPTTQQNDTLVQWGEGESSAATHMDRPFSNWSHTPAQWSTSAVQRTEGDCRLSPPPWP